MNFVLTTERLTLQPFARASLENFLSIVNDERVLKYLWDGEPVSRSQAERLLAESERSFRTNGFGLWSIDIGSGIGFTGLRFVAGTQRIELLFGLSYHVWGRGYASEATGKILDYAAGTLGLHGIEASAHVSNMRSLRLLARLGMHAAGTDETPVGPLRRFYAPQNTPLPGTAQLTRRDLRP